MKESLKKSLVRIAKVRYPDKVNGGEFERIAMQMGFKASNCSRRLRELENEGMLKNDYINGTVWYQYVLQQEEKPMSELDLLKYATQ